MLSCGTVWHAEHGGTNWLGLWIKAKFVTAQIK